jgi:hypothetical protein
MARHQANYRILVWAERRPAYENEFGRPAVNDGDIVIQQNDTSKSSSSVLRCQKNFFTVFRHKLHSRLGQVPVARDRQLNDARHTQ